MRSRAEGKRRSVAVRSECVSGCDTPHPMAAGPSSPQQPTVAGGSRLLGLIGDTAALLEIDEFRHGLLYALKRAVPAEWLSLTDIGPELDQIAVISDPPPPAGLLEAFRRYAYENPLVRRHNETRDARVWRFSDVVTHDELHALSIYREVYKPLGIEYQIAFTLPHASDRILGVALSRCERDFGDDERDLLERWTRSEPLLGLRRELRRRRIADPGDRGRCPSAPPPGVYQPKRVPRLSMQAALRSGEDHGPNGGAADAVPQVRTALRLDSRDQRLRHRLIPCSHTM